MAGVISDGRLFQLRLERSAAARTDALTSIRQLPCGRWTARIGGRLRGRTETFLSRRAAEMAVKAHYDDAMMRRIVSTTKG